VRRLCALVEGLPPDAAIERIDGQQWTVSDELLALVAERVDAWGLLNARVGTDKKFHRYLPDEPLRISRPGKQETADRVITDSREIARFFG
jgi:hypothetical protein